MPSDAVSTPGASDARVAARGPAAPARAPRRAPGEVRELLLEAAEEMFSTHGYAYSSTKRIAERAGVAEALLFRHFGNKAQLFRAAIVEPMISALREHSDVWSGFDGPHSAEEPIREFVEMFFGVLSDRRGSALALTAASNYSADVVEDAARPLADVLEGQERVMAQEAERFGYAGLTPAVTARVGVGSVLASAVLRHWLFRPAANGAANGADAAGDVPDERITRELRSMMMHGIRHRPAAGETA